MKIKNLTMKSNSLLFLISLLFLLSCSTHKRSFIQSDEEFVVELKRAQTRGGMVETALQGLFLGAKYLADKTTKSLTSNYSKSISVNNYYNTFSGKVAKSYDRIDIKKYSKPKDAQHENELKVIIRDEITKLPRTRGGRTLEVSDVIREENDDMLSFHAVIGILSDSENPGVSRLSFDELRILFSKTRIYEDENLNAVVSIQLEGQYRNKDGSPEKRILIEQEYDFRNLKYGPENQIKSPILSPWFYDIPITSEIDKNAEFGVMRVNVQVREYEGGKSKYINQIPTILSKNKNAIVKDGASAIEKIID